MDPLIILCCIKPSCDSEMVTLNYLKSIFSGFGLIQDMKMCLENSTLKVFIHYQEKESSDKAIKILHGKNTRFGHLDLSVTDLKEIPNKAKLFPEGMESLQAVNISSLLKFPTPFSKTTKSLKTDLTLPMIEASDYTIESSPERNALKNPTTSRQNTQSSLIYSYNSNTNPSNNCISNINATGALLPMHLILDNTHEGLSPSRNLKCGNSPVLKVQNLENQNLRPKFITNLFGCFGNVVHVLFNKTLGFALVEFQTTPQAEIAFNSLEGLMFFGAQLKLEFSVLKVLSPHISVSDSDNLVFYKNDHKAFRYSRENAIRVNEPSSLLHITGIPDQVSPLILFQIVQQIREPVKIIQLKKNLKSYHMYLLQFDSLEHSLEVLSVLHNKLINEKYVKVSFSHSKL